MSWINARRRRPAAGYAALLLGLVVVALVYGSLTSRGGVTEASATVGAQQDIAAGAASFHDEVAGAWNGDGSLAGAVYSMKVGVATLVTAYRVGNVPDNLRNRKTGLIESYVTVNA